jgi:hypothetical protein
MLEFSSTKNASDFQVANAVPGFLVIASSVVFLIYGLACRKDAEPVSA